MKHWLYRQFPCVTLYHRNRAFPHVLNTIILWCISFVFHIWTYHIRTSMLGITQSLCICKAVLTLNNNYLYVMDGKQVPVKSSCCPLGKPIGRGCTSLSKGRLVNFLLQFFHNDSIKTAINEVLSVVTFGLVEY